MRELAVKFIDWCMVNNVSASEAIMNMLIGLACLVAIVSMWRLHGKNGQYRNFNLVYLIVSKDGYPDGAKCMEIGAWLIMTWGFLALVTSGKLSDAYTAAYVGAFAMRGAFGAYMRGKGDPPLAEGTTSVTESTTKTTDVTKTAPLKDPI